MSQQQKIKCQNVLIYLHELCCLCSIQNSPPQLENVKAFAEAYLHFIVFALVIKYQGS